MKKLLFFALFFLSACPQPAISPTPDASDGGVSDSSDDLGAHTVIVQDSAILKDRFDLACANLKELHCKEGDAPNCAHSMRVGDSVLGDYRPACVISAKTPAELRSRCGPTWKKACP